MVRVENPFLLEPGFYAASIAAVPGHLFLFGWEIDDLENGLISVSLYSEDSFMFSVLSDGSVLLSDVTEHSLDVLEQDIRAGLEVLVSSSRFTLEDYGIRQNARIPSDVSSYFDV